MPSGSVVGEGECCRRIVVAKPRSVPAVEDPCTWRVQIDYKFVLHARLIGPLEPYDPLVCGRGTDAVDAVLGDVGRGRTVRHFPHGEPDIVFVRGVQNRERRLGVEGEFRRAVVFASAAIERRPPGVVLATLSSSLHDPDSITSTATPATVLSRRLRLGPAVLVVVMIVPPFE